jgi:DNA modification methylase
LQTMIEPVRISDLVTSYTGSAKKVLPQLPASSIHLAVTSPPYFKLRSYLPPDHPEKGEEVGQEDTPTQYIDRLVEVCEEVRRVLRDDGSFWLNLGDTYAANRSYQVNSTKGGTKHSPAQGFAGSKMTVPKGMKPKDLMGIPWMAAFALRDAGWYLRCGAPWIKRNAMPDSSNDRPNTTLEYLFLFGKSAHYYYDKEGVKLESRLRRSSDWWLESVGMLDSEDGDLLGFDVNTKAYKGAHFAVFPPKLVEPIVAASTSDKGCCQVCETPHCRVVEKERVETRPGVDTKVTGDPETEGRRDPKRHVTHSKTVGWEADCSCSVVPPVPCTVLDPFAGSGVVGEVCQKLGRRAILIDLDDKNLELQRKRVQSAVAG